MKTIAVGKYAHTLKIGENVHMWPQLSFGFSFCKHILWIALIPPTDITTGGLPSPSQTPSRRQPSWNKPTLLTGQQHPPLCKIQNMSQQCHLFPFTWGVHELFYQHLKTLLLYTDIYLLLRHTCMWLHTSVCTHVVMWCNASQISIDTSAVYLSSMPPGYVQARNCVYFLCLLWQVLATIFSPISMRHNQVGRSCSSS